MSEQLTIHDIQDRLAMHTKAVSFIGNYLEENAAAALHHVYLDMEKTEEMLELLLVNHQD